ncbi:hypothetical protein BdWA1_000374 [Babesia duncani]|uniref:Uncharacterized protein n=1 Tax=Babesia duncani TaxID=323732 RepID=A0AAD9PM24_9APIC|nr:hypothetical protein BdWA1_000374 [Babesia duncani]
MPIAASQPTSRPLGHQSTRIAEPKRLIIPPPPPFAQRAATPKFVISPPPPTRDTNQSIGGIQADREPKAIIPLSKYFVPSQLRIKK